MSKVEITGPREILMPVLETIRRLAVLQIDADIRERMDKDAESHLRPLSIDGRTLAERLFLEDLRLKIGRLLELLPAAAAGESWLTPSSAINSIAKVVGKHIEVCEEHSRRRAALEAELGQLNRYQVFLTTVESLVPEAASGRASNSSASRSGIPPLWRSSPGSRATFCSERRCARREPTTAPTSVC